MKEALPRYYLIVFIQLLLLLVARVYEFVEITARHITDFAFISEVLGFLCDAGISGLFLTAVFPLYYLLLKLYRNAESVLFLTLLILLFFVKIIILQYFIFELKPLDMFLFRHTRQEVLSVISSVDIPYAGLLVMIFLTSTIVVVIYRLSSMRGRMRWVEKSVPIFIGLTMLVNTIQAIIPLRTINKDLTENKAIYFYRALIRNLFAKQHVKFGYDNSIVNNYRKLFANKKYWGDDYPFLHYTDTADVLGNYFNISTNYPNIVILTVEGLGDDFIHPYHGLNLMPFLDSLAHQSLYWDHFLTLGERSYAVTASLIGSLPYGEIGFTLLDKQPPHFSLVNVLKANGYNTSFFYGQGAWFHNKNIYYDHNFIDRIEDKSSFPEKFEKIILKKDGYFWGYNDMNLFRHAAEVTPTDQEIPRLDIFFTGTMHNPFVFDDQEKYNEIIRRHISKLPEEKNFFVKYRTYISSVMFTDDAIRWYINWYSQHPEFERTIFIITGDHPMTDIPISNSIKRFHVPMIIYSPMLKSGKRFTGVSSHLDVEETLFGFLKNGYKMKIPLINSCIGNRMDTSTGFKCKHPVIFMNGNRDIVDIYDGDFMLSDGKELQSVDQDFNMKNSENPDEENKLKEYLNVFSAANNYACVNDKLIPDSVYHSFLGIHPYYSTDYHETGLKDEEFADIIPAMNIKNEAIYFDLSIFTLDAGAEPPLIVYSLKNAKGESVLWKSEGIPKIDKSIGFHFRLPKQDIKDTILTFSSCIYNKSRKSCKFRFKAALYPHPFQSRFTRYN